MYSLFMTGWIFTSSSSSRVTRFPYIDSCNNPISNVYQGDFFFFEEIYQGDLEPIKCFFVEQNHIRFSKIANNSKCFLGVHQNYGYFSIMDWYSYNKSRGFTKSFLSLDCKFNLLLVEIQELRAQKTETKNIKNREETTLSLSLCKITREFCENLINACTYRHNCK